MRFYFKAHSRSTQLAVYTKRHSLRLCDTQRFLKIKALLCYTSNELKPASRIVVASRSNLPNTPILLKQALHNGALSVNM